MDHLILANKFEVRVGEQVGEAGLSYFTGDPYAIYLVVNSTSGPVPWIFSRELLKGGGEGDVKVFHYEDMTTITLSSGDGSATLIFNRFEFLKYITAIYLMVPEGSESDLIDWDAEFSMINPKEG